MSSTRAFVHDLVAGFVVFLVALPLCLGIALASGAELFTGLLAGIVGGLVVATISGSQTSVSGPAAGLATIVAAQIAILGSFDAFLLAVVIAGLIQIGFGIAKGGALSAFFPSSVVKGLLVAIGVILILKQLPHVLGHDLDLDGKMSFLQPNGETTFSELSATFSGGVHPGAMVIGLLSVGVLLLWDRVDVLRKSLVPAPLLVVVMGVALTVGFGGWGERWAIGKEHLVEIPIAQNLAEFSSFLTLPDFSQFGNPAVYLAAISIAVVASLNTLLSLEAVDKMDPLQRNSSPSRELVAQGCGNVVCGLIGGLPVTSVIVRGTVNVDSGNRTKMSAVFHGVLLLLSMMFLPQYLNTIPLSALAAILLVTGFKLASPRFFKQMWSEGRYQFVPFIVTVIAIVMTDLLTGILVGLGVAVLFILNSNLRRPIHCTVESRVEGDVTHVELANQVSFLNRAALQSIFDGAVRGSRMMIDAKRSDYIDPDVLSLIRDFADTTSPARGVSVNLVGFKPEFQVRNMVRFSHHTTRESKDTITPDRVIEIMREGNHRFVDGKRLNRDLTRQVGGTAEGQFPFAAVLSCIDSRVPTELVFDLGVGDIFSVRVAGNVVGTKTLGSLEYGVGVSGVKLVVVLGHTRCGAVTSSVKLVCSDQDAEIATGCGHLQSIVDEIAPSIGDCPKDLLDRLSPTELESYIDDVSKRNVLHTVDEVIRRSAVIGGAAERGEIKVVGAMYNVRTGAIVFLGDEFIEPADVPAHKSFVDSPH